MVLEECATDGGRGMPGEREAEAAGARTIPASLAVNDPARGFPRRLPAIPKMALAPGTGPKARPPVDGRRIRGL
jgi:hypothetical protein